MQYEYPHGMRKFGTDLIYTDEQKLFIEKALSGCNILVNACVGSGKTTAIQGLCTCFPENKRILYLTYNKLLKIDAKQKIKGKNIIVQNYHGYAYLCLHNSRINVGVSDLLQAFNREKPFVGRFDLIVLDEYQDIDREIADMLDYIVGENPTAQLIAVGDMNQKIYDKSTLEVQSYIERFLKEHIKLEFTKCFRLPAEYAAKLGRVWKKKIDGVNGGCKIAEMSEEEIVPFLARQDPGKLLCLGAREGIMAKVLNKLEADYIEKFNKNTVYASIRGRDESKGLIPGKSTAIFTTFDSSKGLERDICVVFDFTESYWQTRMSMPLQSYEILRNVFLVAASRGKKKIIFVPGRESPLSEETLSAVQKTNTRLSDVVISEMFDFKFREDIEECYALLKKKKIETRDKSKIDIPGSDGLIDLSPCIGIYQEVFYFKKYAIDNEIDMYNHIGKKRKQDCAQRNLEEKILYLASLETHHERYMSQVVLPLVSDEHRKLLSNRLAEKFSRTEEVQVPCSILFADEENKKTLFGALGLADVVKGETVYELKFVSQISHEHFLQCACYMIALGKDKGVLWNTKTNEMWEISIPNKQKFLDSVARTITKRRLTEYHKPKDR